MCGCTYFSSDEWRDRLLTDIERVWGPRDILEIADTDSIADYERGAGTGLRATLEATSLSDDDVFTAWAAEHDIDLRTSCPHPEVADGRCRFHLPVDHPEKTEAALAERVTELVCTESTGDRAKYFVGAKFGSLSLPHQRLESADEQPIQFAHCSAERLDLTKSSVRTDVVAVGARFNTFDASRATFEGTLSFTGAEFGTVTWPAVTCRARADFRDARFRDEATFEHAHFERRADFADADIEDVIDLGGVVFEGAAVFNATAFETAVFSAARFDGIAEFDGAYFRGSADFTGDEFTNRASFEGASFCERADFADRIFRHAVTFAAASFDGEAIFERTRIEGQVAFDEATFDDGMGFNKARIDGRADFDGIVVDGRASLSDIDFGSNVDFGDAVFEDSVTFMWTTFPETASFGDASFRGAADFSLAEFDRLTSFTGATFDGETTFEATHFEAAIAFDEAVFRGSVTFEKARIAHASFDETEAAVPIPIVNAVVTAGTVVQPSEGATYYDFTDSTIGDVTLEGPRNVFELVRFEGTTFDGFDFSHHTEALAASEWRIHRTEPPKPRGHGTPPETPEDETVTEALPGDGSNHTESPSTLQDTYLKAKNGADDMGQNTAAAEFFLREMYYKRQVHRELASDPDRTLGARVSSLLQYTYNLTFSVTAGYGERPSRTALSSVVTIGLFAGLFQGVAGLPLEIPLYLRISLQAFVALIFGDVPTASSFQLLSALEAFIGAFFIALFVFTLTRSVNR